ncbi:MAG: hypothetical protein QM681_21345 [Novosphingobium sp.]
MHRKIQYWQGPKYHHGLRGGKILLVGESHYSNENLDVAQVFNFTADVVKSKALQNEIAFFRHIRLTALGGQLADHEIKPEDFWNSVAFCNVVQDIAPEPSRGISGRDALIVGWKALGETIEELRPDVMLVYSLAAWDHEVPNWWGNVTESRIFGNSDALIRFTNGEHTVLAAGMNHPRSLGARRDVWVALAELVWQEFAAGNAC